FAAAGNQASALGGRVQMYSAQSPAFLNGVNNPSAVTANFTGVSNPLGVSINNAFGRVGPPNAPPRLAGDVRPPIFAYPPESRSPTPRTRKPAACTPAA